MIFKITYQLSKNEAPRRENTQTLYIEADSAVEARKAIEKNTPYNIEFIQPLEGAHLEYEEKSENFKVMTMAELSE